MCENAVNLPPELDAFLCTLLNGSTEITTEYCHRVQRLVNSFGQDIYGVTGGRQKPPKQMLLPYGVKTLTNDVELIRMLTNVGMRSRFLKLKKLNAALCLQKLALTGDNAALVPDNIQAFVNNSPEWDNIDRL